MKLWNPISTAPKDGTAFLAFCPPDYDSEFIGHNEPRYQVCYYSISGDLYSSITQFEFENEDLIGEQEEFHPTNWCKLPNPPSMED